MEYVVSSTIFSSLMIPIMFYAGYRDTFYLKLLGGLVMANVVVEFVKPMCGSSGFFGRPAEARRCDAFCIGGAVGGVPGFPSGHMTNVSLLISALWFHTRQPIVLIVGVPWIGAMAWARWRTRCHNWQQIIAGTCVGTVLGSVIAGV